MKIPSIILWVAVLLGSVPDVGRCQTRYAVDHMIDLPKSLYVSVKMEDSNASTEQVTEQVIVSEEATARAKGGWDWLRANDRYYLLLDITSKYEGMKYFTWIHVESGDNEKIKDPMLLIQACEPLSEEDLEALKGQSPSIYPCNTVVDFKIDNVKGENYWKKNNTQTGRWGMKDFKLFSNLNTYKEVQAWITVTWK